jgi:hypothetical protein
LARGTLLLLLLLLLVLRSHPYQLPSQSKKETMNRINRELIVAVTENNLPEVRLLLK